MAKITNYIKNFTSWFTLKPKLDCLVRRPDFAEREIWNCSLGENIGFEISGKSKDFLRPVLIFKRLTPNTFLAIPLTTKLKNGSWYYPSFVDSKEGRYIFNQVRMVDSKRLNYKIAQISPKTFTQVKQAFLKFIQ